MAMDVSKLGIEVSTTGIKEASAELGGLSRSAGNASKRIETLTGKMTALLTATANQTAGAAALNGMMGNIASALSSASASAQALSIAINQTNTGISQLTQNTNAASGALREKNKWAGTMVTTLKAMTAAALAYVGIGFVKESVTMADAWALNTAKLKIATGSMQNANIAQKDLFDMAQRLRVPLDEMTKLFSRLAPAMRNNGKGFEDTKNMIEGLNLALQLNGSTAGESASVMLQFSQAMQKGRLDGAEFNAIAENGSLVMRALEAETKQNSATLKKWGSQGKITFELIEKAMKNNLTRWREEFNSLPVTVEGAGQRIKNAWMKAMGEMSQNVGLNKSLVDALATFEKLIPLIRDELVKAFIAVSDWIDKNKAGMGEYWEQIKGAVTDVFRMVGNMVKLLTSTNDTNLAFERLAKGIYYVRLGVAIAVDLMKVFAGLVLGIGTLFASAVAVPILAVLKYIEFINNRFKDLLSLGAKAADALGFKDMGKALQDAADGAGKFADGAGDIATVMQDILGASAKLSKNLIIGGDKSEMQSVIDSEKERLEAIKNRAETERAANQENFRAAEHRAASFDNAAFAAGAIAAKKVEDEKAHIKAMKEADSLLQKQIGKYNEMAQALEDIKKYGPDDKRTAIEKEHTELVYAFAKAKDAEARSVIGAAIAYNEAARLKEIEVNGIKSADKAAKEYGKTQDENVLSSQKELDAINDKIAEYGGLKGSVEDAALAQAKLIMLQQGDSMTDEQAAKQLKYIKNLEDTATAQKKLAAMQAQTKLDKFFDKDKVAGWGNAFEKAFGKVGKNIDNIGKAYDNYNKKLAENAEAQKDINKLKEQDPQSMRAVQEEMKLAAKQKDDQLAMYGELASAAKGFFGEKTAAAKALHAVEQGIAMQRMMTTMQEAGISVSASLEKAGASTLAGAAKAFEQMGVYGFIGAAAIMAFMASKGVGGGGGGGGFNPESAENRQKRQGTGTVLGDSADEHGIFGQKSESISKSLDRLNDNSNIGLTFTSQMAASLRNIDMKMGGLTATAARLGFATGKNFGVQNGTSKSGLFGLNKTTNTVIDAGFSLNGTVGGLSSGVGASQYKDIEQKKKKFWGSTKTSTFTETQAIGGQAANEIASIFTDITSTISRAGVALGASSSYIDKTLSDFVINTTVSLKDLKGDDLKEAINSVFSAAADDMAMSVLSGFAGFQKVGEGFFETIVRVASGTEQAKNALDGLGVNMISLMDVQNKAGEVDVELVRNSLMAAESGTTLAHIMEVMGGSMDDLIDGYKDLTRVRNAMLASGSGSNLSLDLIRGAGGVSQLASAFDDFLSAAFDKADLVKINMSKLNMEFGRLGYQVPTTQKAFRELVQGLMNGTAAQQETAGRLMLLSSDWSDAMGNIEESTKSATDAIDAARSALKDAYDRESESLTTVRDKMKGFSDSLKEFKASLLTGDLSTGSIMEKYQNALITFNDISSKAQAGDEGAIGKLQGAAESLLALSRQVNASGAGYTADFDRVIGIIDIVGTATETQADVAQQSLDALNAQVTGLIDINESVLTVAQAIADLTTVMNGGTVGGASVDGSHAAGLANVPFDGYIAELHKGERVLTAGESKEYAMRNNNDDLCAAITALQSEVQTLRTEQAQQTAAVIASNYDAAEANANAVVAGSKDAATDAAYIQRTTIGLN